MTARTANYAGHEGIEDVAVAMLAFASGATASLVSVWHDVLTRPSGRRVEVFCERGLVWLDDDFAGPLHVETTGGRRGSALPAARVGDRAALARRPHMIVVSHYAEANRAFLDAIAAGRAAVAGPRGGPRRPPAGRRRLPLRRAGKAGADRVVDHLRLCQDGSGHGPATRTGS